ncbi:hypothetical protein ACW5WQ_21535, partial [Aeromonas rivuli]
VGFVYNLQDIEMPNLSVIDAMHNNQPDFSALETDLVAELAAWHATAQIDLAALKQCRKQLRTALAGFHRRSYACCLLGQKCRIYRHFYNVSTWNIHRTEHQLANLRCDEPLPF